MADSSDTRQRVLRMLADGVITAEEANELLNAMGGRPAAGASPAAGPSLQGVVAARPPAGLTVFRRLSQAGIVVAAAFVFFGALGLFLLYRAGQEVSPLAVAGFWAIAVVATAAMVVAILAQRSTWLYLEVRPSDGPRIALGLPMPLALASGALKLARPFVPAEHAASLSMAAAFIAAMRHNPRQDPLQLRVQEEGADVEIYLG